MQTQYVYDAFGNTVNTISATTNNVAFSGREIDPTGLYFYRARYYNPQLQRFISEDPIDFDGGDVNLYAYVQNNPIDSTGPFGLRPLSDCEKQKLRSYIPKIDLDNADLHVGEVPWYLGKDYTGITRGNDIYFRPDVYDPSNINGLAILGRELVHVGQYRNGLTWMKFLLASKHGYDKNPYEKPAYAKQNEIKLDMAKRKCGGCAK